MPAGLEEQAVSALVACCKQVKQQLADCNSSWTRHQNPTARTSCIRLQAVTTFHKVLENLFSCLVCSQDLVSLLLEAELDEHYGVPLDLITLLHQDAALSNTLLQAPQHTLQVLEDALISAQASSGSLEQLGSSACLLWHFVCKPSSSTHAGYSQQPANLLSLQTSTAV